MKALLAFGACLLSLTLFQSCAEMATGSTYPPRSASPVSVSSGVSLLRTDNSRWAYDPYRRSYYDQTARRYYDSSSRRYHSSTPRRYEQASYPSGYRRGEVIDCPGYLPHVETYRGRDRGYDRNRDQRDYYRERDRNREYAQNQRAASVKQAYKDVINRENAQFDALMKRQKSAYDRRLIAEARAYKSRPRSKAEAVAYKSRIADMESRFKREVYQQKLRHKNHVDSLLRSYKTRTR